MAFRFSPRPNRAAEIHWQTWSAEPFAQAASQGKLVLLSISAVWCHWCHVMDEETYSAQTVIDLVNERFIAVRVDNDERPDINARYNMGGWPSTVVLTAKGEILSGATYVPPSAMVGLLDRVERFYASQKDQIAGHLQQARMMRDERIARISAPVSQLDPVIPGEVLAAVMERFDEEHGGFGDAPKFPQADALAFVLSMWRLARLEEHRAQARREIRSGVVTDKAVFTDAALRCEAVVRKSLSGMIYGGLYDRDEGGFYRYATKADWSVPHYEKMAEDHALLLPVIAGAYRITKDDDLRQVMQETWQWIRTNLFLAENGMFGGSQDADEHYAASDAEAKRALPAPFVDRSAYAQTTAGLAGALFGVADALDDNEIADCARGALDALHEHMRDATGLLYHIQPADGSRPRIERLLIDQVAYVQATLDAYEFAGEPRFLDRAHEMMELLLSIFWQDGRLRDHAHDDSTGALSEPEFGLRENASAAESMLRLAGLLDLADYRKRAETILCNFANEARESSLFAAKFAAVVSFALTPQSTLRIQADRNQASEFLRAAKRVPDPYLLARTQLTDEKTSEAYLCRGTTCAAPIGAPDELRSAWENILAIT
jgi:uncharacterized protein YyaL (SSP411 family)